MTTLPTIQPGQLWRNGLGMELTITGSAGYSYPVLSADIWVAKSAADPLFGSREYLVTATSLADAGYEFVEEVQR